MSYQLWQDISFYLNEIDREKEQFGRTLITPETLESHRIQGRNLNIRFIGVGGG